MNLTEAGKRVVEERLEWLQQAQQAQKLVGLLPQAIQEAEASAVAADVTYDDKLGITFHFWGNDKADRARELMGLLVSHGAAFQKPTINPYGGTFSSTGSMNVNNSDLGVEVKLTIVGVAIPPNCEVVKKRRMRWEYQAVCANSVA